MTHLVALVATLLCACAAVESQNYRTTPVPILKQINRHNDDGSYSYGYEAADGSFKIETKYPTGEVYGKYGYVGDDGKVREIEYGASKRGFEPAGSDINVPPPTLTNGAQDNSLDYDDGQYREDPTKYYNSRRPASTRTHTTTHNSDFQHYRFTSNTPAPPPPPPPTPAPYHPPAPRYYNPQPYNTHYTGGAANVNLQTGSYSLSYSG